MIEKKKTDSRSVISTLNLGWYTYFFISSKITVDQCLYTTITTAVLYIQIDIMDTRTKNIVRGRCKTDFFFPELTISVNNISDFKDTVTVLPIQ